MLVDLDTGTGIADPGRARQQLQMLMGEAHGVVIGHGAPVLETTDAGQIHRLRHRCIGRTGHGWFPHEPLVMTWQKGLQEPIGVGDGRDPGEGEFDNQSILQRAEEPFDPPFGLWGMSGNRLNAQFGNGPANLGERWPSSELVIDRLRLRVDEDLVFIVIQRQWASMRADQVRQQLQIALTILGLAEVGADDFTGGIVNPGHQHGLWLVRSKPVML